MSFERTNEHCPAAHSDILECGYRIMHKMEQDRSWMLIDECWQIFADEVVNELSNKAGITYKEVKTSPLEVYTRISPVAKEEQLALLVPTFTNSHE